ncbi:hypothetical protein JOM56_001116 [Amanita muscaria]
MWKKREEDRTDMDETREALCLNETNFEESDVFDQQDEDESEEWGGLGLILSGKTFIGPSTVSHHQESKACNSVDESFAHDIDRLMRSKCMSEPGALPGNKDRDFSDLGNGRVGYGAYGYFKDSIVVRKHVVEIESPKLMGQHMHWTHELETPGSQYLRRTLNPERSEEPTPPYISIHVRHGDFDFLCRDFDRPIDECFSSLDVIEHRVEEVQLEL